MTATNGLRSAARAVPDMVLAEGSCGKTVLSSRSPRLLLTIAGRGTKATDRTAAAEVRNPLMISSVDKNAVQACLTRGGWLRVEARSTIDTRHKRGRTKISGEHTSLAHQGTIGGSLGSRRPGPSMVRGIASSSWVLTTILSMTEAKELQRYIC